ncbi:hypothetical protein JJJ17_01145 [Paracoccus caeni]|uniref:Uncharacterized protein n=1 Tax=Paracoccus caeni TaxID=657651 RepID=A0A934SB81_9RHOB|nr:hypothetical protein [Paracoccus caeni]MBK4214523.1 hypothetical protein [Paracoccus caeni]
MRLPYIELAQDGSALFETAFTEKLITIMSWAQFAGDNEPDPQTVTRSPGLVGRYDAFLQSERLLLDLSIHRRISSACAGRLPPFLFASKKRFLECRERTPNR